MKILAFCQFPEGYNESFRSKLRAICPDAEIVYCDDCAWSETEYHAALRDADVIIGHLPPKDLQYCTKLKLMQMDIAGADSYVRSPYLPEETVLCNASGAYGVVLAEHAVALVMALCRDLPLYVQNKLRHEWLPSMPDKPVEGGTVLILGAGDIGVNTARLLRPLAARIIGVRRVRRSAPEGFDEMIGFDELDDYLPQADFVCCSLPSTPETVHLLDARRLRLMKEDAVLVNVGRGSLIPTADLCAVLGEGRLRGVGIDVCETEPLPPDSPLWDCERLIITPHTAGNAMTQDSPTNRRIYEIIWHNLESYIAGRPLDHVVDRKTGYRKTDETCRS